MIVGLDGGDRDSQLRRRWCEGKVQHSAVSPSKTLILHTCFYLEEAALRPISDSGSGIIPAMFLWKRLSYLLRRRKKKTGVPSADRNEVFNKPSDDFLEGAQVKEEKQMKELVSKCRWFGKASQELIIQ